MDELTCLHLQWSNDMKLFAKSAAASKSSFVDIPSGKVKLGVETDGSCGFVWDNEGPPKVTKPTCIGACLLGGKCE